MPNFLDLFETAVLFRLARLLTLIIIAIGFVALVGGIVQYKPLFKESPIRVNANEIRSELSSSPQQPPLMQQGNKTPGSSVDRELDQFIAAFDRDRYDWDQLRAEVLSWIQQLPNPEARVQFLSDMTAVVTEFSQQDRGSAAYAFARIRFQKEAERALQASKVSSSREQGKIYFLYGTGIVGVFSLVLVLLRIERNTRHQH